jgi:hypothetical protein
MIGSAWSMNWKWWGRMRSETNLRQCPEIFLEGLRKRTKKIRQFVSRVRIEPGTSRMQSRSVTTWSNFIPLQLFIRPLLILLFLPWRIRPSGLFPFRLNSEIMDLTDSCQDSLDGWSALSQGRYLHRTTQKEETDADIHASSGIRTHDPSIWAGDDISCLRPRIHCNQPTHKIF